jgi:membrane fusion protein (multidrug efflux system)
VKRMNHLRCCRTWVSVAVILIVSAALPFSIGCNSHPQAQAASVSASATAETATPRSSLSSVAPVSPEIPDARHFTTTGPLVAEQQADIAAERDGRVMQIAVEIGDRVHKGQLLARLDDRTLRSACDSQRARVASLHAQVDEWEAEQKSGEADLRRADIMRSEKIRSEEDWEHVKYKLDETIAEVARYRAEEVSAEADLEMAKLQLEQSRIVAPFAGVVGRSSVRTAQEVKKGDVLFWITAEAPLHILFTVPESAMAFFPAGARLELTTADYPELRQSAKILRVSPVVDPGSGSVQVIGIVPHASRLLKPGMSMQVRLAP